MSKEHLPGHEPDFSSRQISLGMSVQQLGKLPIVGGVYRAARNFWAGSDSPSQVWVEWNGAPWLTSFESDAMPVSGPGNPEAGRRPRTYNKAMVIGAAQVALHAIRDEVGSEGVDAIGYQHHGKSYAAVLPDGFGAMYPEDDTPMAAAALRVGKNPPTGMVGLWYEERRELIIPHQEIISAGVPVDRIAARYPGVPMV